MDIESTQPASNLPEPVYPWFQVAWDIAQEMTGWSEEDLIDGYIELANKNRNEVIGLVVEELGEPSLEWKKCNEIAASNEEAVNHYSLRKIQTELGAEIARALLKNNLFGYSPDGCLIREIESLGLLNPACNVCVRPSQVNRFLAERGHNFQWNPKQIEDGAVSAEDFGKPPAGRLGQNPEGVETSYLAHAFKGIGLSEVSWKRVLGKSPQWLSASRCAKGKRGGRNREARWDPVAFGLAVKDKYKIPLNRIRARFQTIDALKPWLDRWNEAAAFHYPDE